MSNAALLERVEKIEALATQVKETKKELAPGTPDPKTALGVPTGAPRARKGENIMGSRGYSILRMVKAKINPENKINPWEDAKIEMELHAELKGAFAGNLGNAQFDGGTLAPFSSAFMPDTAGKSSQLANRVKSLLAGGIDGGDPEEMLAIGRKVNSPTSFEYGVKSTAQSWLDQAYGGALVGPPDFGEPIALWRNRDALVRAGATVAPMPPTGRFVAPAQTTASVAYHQGEGVAATGTQVQTDQITWTAKKLTALLRYSREILQFGGAAAEMLFRTDLVRSIVLGMDKQLLDGVGSETKPRGLVGTAGNVGIAGMATVTPTTVATDGNTIAPQDLYSFRSAVEENNIPDDVPCTFIMRPQLYFALLKRRVDAVTASDAAGLFAFSPFRQIGDKINGNNINGERVITTTQVSKTRTKGSGTALTYMLYGYWPDYLILMSPVMEFVVANQGNPDSLGDLFSQDQFVLKTLVFYDGNTRHAGGFALCDQLLMS